jgi:hypothetical protein
LQKKRNIQDEITGFIISGAEFDKEVYQRNRPGKNGEHIEHRGNGKMFKENRPEEQSAGVKSDGKKKKRPFHALGPGAVRKERFSVRPHHCEVQRRKDAIHDCYGYSHG